MCEILPKMASNICVHMAHRYAAFYVVSSRVWMMYLDANCLIETVSFPSSVSLLRRLYFTHIVEPSEIDPHRNVVEMCTSERDVCLVSSRTRSVDFKKLAFSVCKNASPESHIPCLDLRKNLSEELEIYTLFYISYSNKIL